MAFNNLNGKIPFTSLKYRNPRPNGHLLNLFPTNLTYHPNHNQTTEGSSSVPFGTEPLAPIICPCCGYTTNFMGGNVQEEPPVEVERRFIDDEWTLSEDWQLMKLVQAYEGKKWGEIAKMMPKGRYTAYSCKKRWEQEILPKFKKYCNPNKSYEEEMHSIQAPRFGSGSARLAAGGSGSAPQAGRSGSSTHRAGGSGSAAPTYRAAGTNRFDSAGAHMK